MKGDEKIRMVQLIKNEGNDQGEMMIIPMKYEDFKQEMLSKYKYPKTTKYILKQEREDNITIDSDSSYKKMLKILEKHSGDKKQLNISQLIVIQEKVDVDLIQNSKQEGDRDKIKIKENEDQNQILFVSETENQNLSLASNYDQFQKKMEKLYQFAKTTKYIYAADNEVIIIDSSSSYDQVLQNLKKKAKTRTLKVKDDEKQAQQILKEVEPTDDEQFNKNELDYNQLFLIANSKISCVCKFQGKDANKCKLCNCTALINNQQQEGYIELNKEFEILINKNFPKIQKYIQDNYQENVKNFQHWIVFHFKLVNFENQEEFYFKCIKCDKFYVKANIVHVKSLQRPQKPVCDKCFQSNRIDGYISYPPRSQQKNLCQEDDQLPNQPPNLMQQSS